MRLGALLFATAWTGAACVTVPSEPMAPPRAVSLVDGLGPERAEIAARFGTRPLVDQAGRQRDVFEELVRGRIVLIHFMYTRCTGT